MYHDPRLENRYHAWFRIADFECSPDEITKQLGIVPTKTCIKGEYRTVGKKKPVKVLNKNNSWILEANLPNTVSVEKQIQEIVKKLKPYTKTLLSLTKKYTLELTCAIYYYEANPGFNLDKELLKEITQLNVDLGFDIYCLTGTQSQFEYPEVEEELAKQFSKVTQIAKFSEDNKNEANVLAKSFIGIDKAIHNLEMYMEDLVVWEDLTEDEYTVKFKRVKENLRSITKNIEASQYLTSEIMKSKDKNHK